MFERVLIATDGSRLVDETINYAASVFLYSEFHLLCVKKKVQRGTHLTTMYTKMLDESANDALEQGRKLLENTGIQAQCELCEGKPSSEILRYIRAHRIDAVIMMTRTHEQSSVERFVMGSTAENVLKKVRKPILFINPLKAELGTSVKSILLATDGSVSSKKAENFSLLVANHFGAKLTAAVALEEVWEGGEANAEKILSNVQWKANQFNVKVEKKLLRGGSFASMIADEASGFDMLIIGAGRPSFFNRVKIGHIALELITTAQRPVLVVRGY